jgi:hypothetical protein
MKGPIRKVESDDKLTETSAFSTLCAAKLLGPIEIQLWIIVTNVRKYLHIFLW